jgi:hypothetical protein
VAAGRPQPLKKLACSVQFRDFTVGILYASPFDSARRFPRI